MNKMQVADKEAVVEQVVEEVLEVVKNGQVDEQINNFWITHQSEFIHFGKLLVLILIILFLAFVFSRILGKIILHFTVRIDGIGPSVGKIFRGLMQCLIWFSALLMIMDLCGINTASLLTVLGAVGLAIGLAVKDSLSNVAAGLMLLLLRPYKIGDYVDCGTVSGTIEEMGLFTTILKTPDGLFISAPNSAIFGNPIKNYSRNPMRRADITVGISYSDSLPQALAVLKQMLEAEELIIKDPPPEVLVSDLADSSVNLTLRFWAASENYWNVFWKVKYQLKSTLEDAGINIPFPQRVVAFASPLTLENKNSSVKVDKSAS